MWLLLALVGTLIYLVHWSKFCVEQGEKIEAATKKACQPGMTFWIFVKLVPEAVQLIPWMERQISCSLNKQFRIGFLNWFMDSSLEWLILWSDLWPGMLCSYKTSVNMALCWWAILISSIQRLAWLLQTVTLLGNVNSNDFDTDVRAHALLQVESSRNKSDPSQLFVGVYYIIVVCSILIY